MARIPTFPSFVKGLGVTLEPAQRVFWGAGDGAQRESFSESDRQLFDEIFGGVDVIPTEARAVVSLIKGADVGASYIGGLRLLYRALFADLSDAAPGEIRPALCVAPDLRTARIPVRAARAAAERDPVIKKLIASKGIDSIVFKRDGGRFSSVECLPASVGGRATRGRRYVEVLFDEACFFRDEATGQVNDVHVYESVVVRCTGQLWLTSTPWLTTNLAWKLYEENFGNPTTALAARLPTLLVRTSKRVRTMVELARQRDPELAAQEYGCEPLGAGAAQFFGAEELDAALERTRSVQPTPEAGWRGVVGADLGLVRDSSAAVSVHVNNDGRIVMADAVEFRPKRGTPLKLSDVVPAICRFAGQHGAKSILVDHHLLSEASSHCLPGYSLHAVAGGQEHKARRHVRVRTLLKEGRLKIPGAFARVVHQLSEVTAKPTPGGGTVIQYARRRGSHSDLAAALIVAASGAQFAAVDTRQPEGLRPRVASNLGGY